MTALQRTLAQDQLTRALLSLAAGGERPRCGDPVTHEAWLSDDPESRAQAVAWCVGCPILTECGEAADSVGERFGVWAGVDRTRETSKASQLREAS